MPVVFLLEASVMQVHNARKVSKAWTDSELLLVDDERFYVLLLTIATFPLAHVMLVANVLFYFEILLSSICLGFQSVVVVICWLWVRRLVDA